MLNFLKRIQINLEMILKKTLIIAGSIFSIMSIILSFVTWEDFGIQSVCVKIIIFIVIVAASLLLATLYICLWRNKVEIYQNGTSKVNACYGDIMEIAFKNKSKKEKIVVIPVNTCFDTIVDSNIQRYDKPLVSPNTIHGKWINQMIEYGVSREELDSQIKRFLDMKKIKPIRILSRNEKTRGNLNEYPLGTIAIVEGNNNVKFFLVALSKFDINNKAQCTKDELIECIHKIITFYDNFGQGFEMFVPLLGTNLSRVGLSHQDSLTILESMLRMYSNYIHGEVNIIIYSKEKEKVAI